LWEHDTRDAAQVMEKEKKTGVNVTPTRDWIHSTYNGSPTPPHSSNTGGLKVK